MSFVVGRGNNKAEEDDTEQLLRLSRNYMLVVIRLSFLDKKPFRETSVQ